MPRVSILPFKLNHDHRHHISKQKRKVQNWRERQAGALADLVTDRLYAPEFGLAVGRGCALPVIESIRTLRRVGPDRQVRFGLVAEVVQEATVSGMRFYGGSTIILGSDGRVRYVIRRRVDDVERARRQAEYHASPAGQQALDAAAGGQPWMAMHAQRHA
jgi:hypothetical protein